MPRMISFSMTTPQFLDGTKDVTRRMGWLNLKAGDVLMAVEKAMGLGKGGKVQRLGMIRAVNVRREPLDRIADDLSYGRREVNREGFPAMGVNEFVMSVVTRIEFEKIQPPAKGAFMAKAKKAKAAAPKGPKNTKKDKKQQETKADAAAPVAKGSVAQDNVPKADPEMRELARHHRDTYIKRKAALSKAQRDMQALGKEVKGDGFSLRQIKLMVELSTPEGEAAWRMTIANDLIAAQYQGAAIGQQLALFLEPDRTPAVDLAYDEGQQDSMDGKAAKPGYAPSTPQHARYLQGYHDETERRVKKGITKLSEDEQADRAATLAAARGAPPAVPPAPDTKH